MSTSEHIVKSYDEELQRLNQELLNMGALIDAQLAAVINAVIKVDGELAAEVVEQDHAVDQFEHDIDEQAIRVLALRQPIARDLRDVISALKIASDLERIGDYAANIAKRTIALSQIAPAKPIRFIPAMGRLARTLTRDVIDAFAKRDTKKAVAVWMRDVEIDEMYTGLFRQLLTYMMEDPRSITAGTHLLFMAKNIERIGDHATNIAETVYYMVNGEPLKESRPKEDESIDAIA